MQVAITITWIILFISFSIFSGVAHQQLPKSSAVQFFLLNLVLFSFMFVNPKDLTTLDFVKEVTWILLALCLALGDSI